MTPEMALLLALTIVTAPIVLGLIMNKFMTQMLLLSNVALFVFVKFFVWDSFSGWEEVVAGIGLYPPFIAEGVHLQSIYTSMFFHLDSMHVFFNLLFMIMWAPMLERSIGARKLAIVYILTGLAGTLLSLVFKWGDPIIALGASGALFGVAGCYVALYPQREMRLLLLPKMKGYLAVITMFLLMFVLDVLGYFNNIGHEAHLGGMLAGMALGYFVLKPIGSAGPRKVSEKATVENMVPLAITPELQDMLDRAMRADERDVAFAWVQEFLENSHCPSCGATLQNNSPENALRGRLTCEACSWNVTAGSSQPPAGPM